MSARQLVVKGVTIAAISCVPATMALAAKDGGLVQAVREATRTFQDVSAATAAGYSSAGSCVSGPERGAMGVHWPNGALVGDGMLDASKPEILIYEHKGDRMRLLGVEFIVIAEQWHAANASPPVLMGQHFHFVGSPNRYGLPAFYELHVWAWRENPNGSFVDWHPHVSCDGYTGG
jgi:hypothetical protein